MSGHSHFATIKHKKGAADAKRSQVFSKLAKELTVATKEGGADLEANPRLRTVVEKAKAANMPSDNIDRAIKKATGVDAGQLEEILIEAYGPGNSALLISAITDNKNRTIGEIKQILQRNKGKMVEGGAVKWLFERKGVAILEHIDPSKKNDLELQLIEGGAEDINWSNAIAQVYVHAAELTQLKQNLEAQGLKAETSIGWVPKERVLVPESDQTAIERLFEALDDQDDVQDISSNI
jgi:YebC/PmpR family DNA-binding regulatory protein